MIHLNQNIGPALAGSARPAPPPLFFFCFFVLFFFYESLCQLARDT